MTKDADLGGRPAAVKNRLDMMGDAEDRTDPTLGVEAWLAAFGDALSRRDIPAATGLFVDDCYWRDLLAFTWNIKTLEGRSRIAGMLATVLDGTAPRRWQVEGEAKRVDGVAEAWITFETRLARGKGYVRLRDGRCWTLLTTVTELKGFEERKGSRRSIGVGHGVSDDNWAAIRAADEETLGLAQQPTCVIVGGGQGGLALAARLKRLNVPTIVLDTNAKPGDSWRKRYASLVLHDPVWYDHLPYLPFPDDWPIFTPKDKLGDWLEAYAKIMELNFWGSSTCKSASFDDITGTWTLVVDRAGEEVILRPRHFVLATGAYGLPSRPDLPGAAAFAGEIVHSSAYQTGQPYRDRPAVVVGANTSAHDICADLWRNGADVTMIQRSPTTVAKWDTLLEFGFKGLYSEQALAEGITTEKADLLFASMPYALAPVGQAKVYAAIREHDAAFYDALAKTGFLLDFGEDDSGIMMKALRRAAGYYVEVGASDLIIRGEIKVKPGVEVREVRARSVVLTDGSELPADLIVQATGYGSFDGLVAELISPEAARAIGPCWGLGSGTKGDPGPWQGELRNMYKPLAQKNLWFHGGNLHLSRHFSLYVALQIKARQEGLDLHVFEDPAETSSPAATS